MDSYQEWQQNKIYEGHLHRLKKLTLKHSNLKSSQSNLNSSNKKNSSKNTSRLEKDEGHQRSKTQQLKKKESKQCRKMLKVPIPLVSNEEAKLIKNTLNAKHVPLKDKQHLLENYLLSRRILKTKSTIDKGSNHTSHKILPHSNTKSIISYSREQKFRIYSKAKKELKNVEIISEGNNYLEIQIKHLMMIKGVIGKGKDVAYDMDIRVGKHRAKLVKALSYQQLMKKKFQIKWKSGFYNKKPEIMIEIVVLRENFSQQIGIFRPVISEFESQNSQNIKRVYRMMKGKFPVGTIELQGHAHIRPNKHQKIVKYQFDDSKEELKYKTEYLQKLNESSRDKQKEEESILKSKYELELNK